jgi:hypothetical protein
VLNYLSSLLIEVDEGVQIKVIQTVMLMLNPKTLDFSSKEIADKFLSVCINLSLSKSPLVVGSSAACMFQLSTVYFDYFLKLVDDYLLKNNLSPEAIITDKAILNFDVYR